MGRRLAPWILLICIGVLSLGGAFFMLHSYQNRPLQFLPPPAGYKMDDGSSGVWLQSQSEGMLYGFFILLGIGVASLAAGVGGSIVELRAGTPYAAKAGGFEVQRRITEHGSPPDS